MHAAGGGGRGVFLRSLEGQCGDRRAHVRLFAGGWESERMQAGADLVPGFGSASGTVSEWTQSDDSEIPSGEDTRARERIDSGRSEHVHKVIATFMPLLQHINMHLTSACAPFTWYLEFSCTPSEKSRIRGTDRAPGLRSVSRWASLTTEDLLLVAAVAAGALAAGRVS